MWYFCRWAGDLKNNRLINLVLVNQWSFFFNPMFLLGVVPTNDVLLALDDMRRSLAEVRIGFISDQPLNLPPGKLAPKARLAGLWVQDRLVWWLSSLQQNWLFSGNWVIKCQLLLAVTDFSGFIPQFVGVYGVYEGRNLYSFLVS